MDPQRGVFGISVAAELVGTGVQNLRAYERRGLVTPARTAGGTRRYSPADVQRLQRISELLGAGLNLAGIEMVLDLEANVADLHTTVAGMQAAQGTGHADTVPGPVRPAGPGRRSPRRP
jgi:DNA-binding transcriptional MerR regulator